MAVELRLDASVVAMLLSRLTEEEAAYQCAEVAPPAPEPFACTCALLRDWAAAADFPGSWSTRDRSRVLASLASQSHLPGFKDAAGPVVLDWVRDLVVPPTATDDECCVPCHC